MNINVVDDTGFSILGVKSAKLCISTDGSVLEYHFHDNGGVLVGPTTATQFLHSEPSITLLTNKSTQINCKVFFNRTRSFTGNERLQSNKWPKSSLDLDKNSTPYFSYLLSSSININDADIQKLTYPSNIDGYDSEGNICDNYLALQKYYAGSPGLFLIAQQRLYKECYLSVRFENEVISFQGFEIPYTEISNATAKNDRLTIHARFKISESNNDSLTIYLPSNDLALAALNIINNKLSLFQSHTPNLPIPETITGPLCEIFSIALRGSLSTKRKTRIDIKETMSFQTFDSNNNAVSVSYSTNALSTSQGKFFLFYENDILSQIDCNKLTTNEVNEISAFSDRCKNPHKQNVYLFSSPNAPELIHLNTKTKKLLIFSFKKEFPIDEITFKVTHGEADTGLAKLIVTTPLGALTLFGTETQAFNMLFEINYQSIHARQEPKEKLIKVLLGLEQKYWAYQAVGLIEETHIHIARHVTGDKTTSPEILPRPSERNADRYLEALEAIEWTYSHFVYANPRKPLSIAQFFTQKIPSNAHQKSISELCSMLDRSFQRIKPIEAELRMIEAKTRSTRYRTSKSVDADHSGTSLAAMMLFANPAIGLASMAGRYYMAESRKQKLTSSQVDDTIEGLNDISMSWNRLYQFSLGPIYASFMNETFTASTRFWAQIGKSAPDNSCEKNIMEMWCARLLVFLSWPTSTSTSRGEMISALIKRLETEPTLTDSLLI